MPHPPHSLVAPSAQRLLNGCQASLAAALDLQTASHDLVVVEPAPSLNAALDLEATGDGLVVITGPTTSTDVALDLQVASSRLV
jgi:hypothetical protein